MLGQNSPSSGTAFALALSFALPFALAFGFASTGCKPRSAPPPIQPVSESVAPTEPPPPRRIDPQLEAIADQVDPGSVEPLITAMPEWLASAVGSPVPEGEAPAETLRRAQELLAGWESEQEGGDMSIDSLSKLSGAIYLGERVLLSGAANDPELLALLSTLYSILDQPFFTSERGFFRQSMGLIVDAAAREGVLAEQRQVGEFIGFLQSSIGRANALKRHSAATLLREHPGHHAVSQVLATLADDATGRQDFKRAVELSTISLARNHGIQASDQIAHAGRCYAAFDIDAGDAARELAIAGAPAAEESTRRAYDERMTKLDSQRSRAIEAEDLSDDEAIDARLRRGHLLILLGHYDDASRLYEELKSRFPRDSRPYAGLTKVALSRDLSFIGDLPILSARDLENHDRDYYEVSLGLSFGRLMGEIIPAASGDPSKVDALVRDFLAQFREDAVGWGSYEPGRAAVLIAIDEAIGRTLKHGLKGDLKKLRPGMRRMVSDFDRVRKKYPEIAESWRATYVAALFAKNKQKAWRTAFTPLPESLAADRALQIRRLETLRNIVLLWERGDPIVDLEAAIDSVPAAFRDDDGVVETVALVDYLKFLRGDQAAGLRALSTYRGLADRRKGAKRAQALQNLAVVRSQSGDAKGAIATWEEAIAIADERGRDIIYLNAAIQGLSPAVVQTLETLSASEQSVLIRLQALAWRAELAARSGNGVDAAVDDYRNALKTEAKRELRANLPLGGFGVLATGDVTANLNYSVKDGLALVLAVNADTWLVPPAPLSLPASGRKARRPVTSKKKKENKGAAKSGRGAKKGTKPGKGAPKPKPK